MDMGFRRLIYVRIMAIVLMTFFVTETAYSSSENLSVLSISPDRFLSVRNGSLCQLLILELSNQGESMDVSVYVDSRKIVEITAEQGYSIGEIPLAPVSSETTSLVTLWGGGKAFASTKITRKVLHERTTWLPKSNKPADVLTVVDYTDLREDEKLAVTCLQGLTSRKQPVIWLIVDQTDWKWLELHKEKGAIKDYRVETDLKKLFRDHSYAFNGGVIPEDFEKMANTELLACNVASCEDLIVVSEQLADELDILIKNDLRGRFAKFADGQRWVWETYNDILNPYLCGIFYHPMLFRNRGTVAFDIQWRSFLFWVTGEPDRNDPGADGPAELKLLKEILSSQAPNTPVRGYPWWIGNCGLGEAGGTALFGEYAKGLNCTDHSSNWSVMSGVVMDLKPPKRTPAPKLEKDKIYAALAVTDGDNFNTWLDWFYQDFEAPEFGTFPVAFGMGPPLQDIAPVVMQWYFDQAGTSTEFFCDVTGNSYIDPRVYATHYGPRRELIFDEYLEWTDKYMQTAGFETVRSIFKRLPDDMLRRYEAGITSINYHFPGYSWEQHESYDKMTYRLDGKTPVFRAWGAGPDDDHEKLFKQIGDQRPAFVHWDLINWDFRIAKIKKIHDNWSDDVIFVTPSQLADLYMQAVQKGWSE